MMLDTKRRKYFELNICSGSKNVKNAVLEAAILGYDVVAVNTVIGHSNEMAKKSKKKQMKNELVLTSPIKLQITSPDLQKHKLCSAPKIIYRLTITLWTEQDNIRELVAAAQSMYDIVALTPMTDAALIQCCQLGVSPDIISIDGYTEIGNDALKRLSTVAMNDIFVELLYYPCVGSSSSTARQSSIRLNQSVVRAVRGRHVFVSCGSSETACLRSPRDVLGFCSLMGLSEEQAHAALSRVCADLLFCAARRRRQTLTKQRSSYTTTVSVSSDVVLPVAVIKRNIVEHAKRSIMSTNIKRPVKRQKNTNKA